MDAQSGIGLSVHDATRADNSSQIARNLHEHFMIAGHFH